MQSSARIATIGLCGHAADAAEALLGREWWGKGPGKCRVPSAPPVVTLSEEEYGRLLVVKLGLQDADTE